MPILGMTIRNGMSYLGGNIRKGWAMSINESKLISSEISILCSAMHLHKAIRKMGPDKNREINKALSVPVGSGQEKV